MRTSRVLDTQKTQVVKRGLSAICCLLFSACVQTSKKTDATNQRIPIQNLNVIGVNNQGQKIFLGGFSGLRFIHKDPQTGEDVFVTHTDRGPNGEPIKNKKGQEVRPFFLPSFQPKVVWIRVNKERTKATVDHILNLSKADGTAVSGLPNKTTDEIPVDSEGRDLKRDKDGLDLEAIAFESDGSFWMGDEYGPSLIHFDKDGKWINRYEPKNGLPEILKFRKANRGFEGITIKGRKLFAFLQSPLNLKDAGQKAKGPIRIIEFDLDQKKTTGQYVYFFSCQGCDKIGDVETSASGNLLVLERDGKVGPESSKMVYEVSFDGATNIHEIEKFQTKNGAVEFLSEAQLSEAGIHPVKKKMWVDLVSSGFTFSEKAEGLAEIDPKNLAVVNDNDFGVVPGEDTKSYILYLSVQ